MVKIFSNSPSLRRWAASASLRSVMFSWATTTRRGAGSPKGVTRRWNQRCSSGLWQG